MPISLAVRSWNGLFVLYKDELKNSYMELIVIKKRVLYACNPI